MRVYVDIETYSSVDLRKFGVYAYAASPDFKILMAAWSEDGGEVFIDLEQEEIRKRFESYREGGDVTFVAHNAQFERISFSYLLGELYLPPEEWHDTQAIAGEHGFPQRLEDLALALGAEEKDSAGTRLINIFSKPNRKGERTLPEDKPVEWLDFIAYCEQDVYTLIDVDRRLGDWPTEMEQQVFLADQAINDRGIRIDVPMARRAVGVALQNQEWQREAITMLAGVDNPNSQPQMMAWMREEGLPADNLRKETVATLLEGDLTPVQREVLTLRQDLALVASKKYATALESVLPDDRLRGSFKFFGAHTGRWAGRGTQLQNLPREQLETEADTLAAIEKLHREGQADAHTLKALVRAMFTGPFTVVDYSAIEARVVAWLAGEQWALDAFAEGRDIYVETAERMSTPTHPLGRYEGKVAVLALGYNGGTNSLRAMGADGDDAALQRLVDQWRRTNPRIVRLWQRLGDAFGDTGDAGPLLSVTEDEDHMGRVVRMHLPSGRAITYHGVRWERYRVTDPKTGRQKTKEGWRYADPRNPFNDRMRIGTYGGRLTENATQAVARDIMAEALVRLEDNGFRVVGHVHDEILVEGEHDVDVIADIMTQVPDWAAGLPVSGEGFTCERYRKG